MLICICSLWNRPPHRIHTIFIRYNMKILLISGPKHHWEAHEYLLKYWHVRCLNRFGFPLRQWRNKINQIILKHSNTDSADDCITFENNLLSTLFLNCFQLIAFIVRINHFVAKVDSRLFTIALNVFVQIFDHSWQYDWKPSLIPHKQISVS